MPQELQPLIGKVPHVKSHRLPPYRGIVAVDAKDFTGHRSIQHPEISRAIPNLLQHSLNRAKLADIWEDRRFPASTGDGYVFGCDPAAMPFLIHPWLGVLQETLTEFNVHSAGTLRLRLRVSLHIGPLPDDGAESDGNGTPRNDTHRLLDSRPVKMMLAASSENVTQVAAILSDRCFEDAVASGYTGRHPDHFIEVPATVPGKPFAQRGWLHVPAPSGNLYDRRILGDRVIDELESAPATPTAPAPTSAADRPAGTSTVYRVDRGFQNNGQVQGGQTWNDHSGDRGRGDR
ncbi:hypothetical protein [Streptomyces sp. NPDC049881]|uniref:hypothetical protein n=1 Tax=Streptomyces sp. NPDC049881 TaxID=3155778 RepID=UPI00341D84C0